jgi:hypothetical protein
VKSFDQIIEEKIKNAKLPDSVDDGAGFAKAVLKLALEAAKEVTEQQTKPYQVSLENQKKLQQIQSDEQQTTTLIGQYLEGETYDGNQLGKDFQAFTQPILEDNPGYYFGRPELLASDIARFYWAEKAKKVQPSTVVRDLKKKIEGAPSASTSKSVVPQQKKKLTPAQTIEDQIYFRNTGEHLY